MTPDRSAHRRRCCARPTEPLDTATIAAAARPAPERRARRSCSVSSARGVVEQRARRSGEVGPAARRSGASRRGRSPRRTCPHTGWAMARSLARAIPATPARLREVEAAGVELGLELAADIGAAGGADGQDAIGARPRSARVRAAAPRRRRDRPATSSRTCPYAEAVRENPAGRLHAAPRRRPGGAGVARLGRGAHRVRAAPTGHRRLHRRDHGGGQLAIVRPLSADADVRHRTGGGIASLRPEA